MAYDLEGCFEKDGSNGYQAHWADPCGGADITACMELVSGVWQPSHDTVVGTESCVPDSICCKSTANGWVPVLHFDSYDTLEELATGCCEPSGPCSDCFTSIPQYIEVTISGVIPCDGVESSCSAANGTFVLENIEEISGCYWYVAVSSGGITITFDSTNGFRITMPIPTPCECFFYLDADYICDVDSPPAGPFDSQTTSACLDPCLGYSGTISIDWSP